MSDLPKPSPKEPDERQQLRDMNEALLMSSVRQHELTEQADRAEEKARSSEARLSRILKQSPAGIVQTDAQGRMVLVNERWCEMLGYSEAELLGMSVTDVTHASSLNATLEAVGRLAEGGPDFQIEKNYRRKDDTMLRANSNVAALRDAEGNFEGLLAVVLDLTERFEAEEQLREREARLSFSLQAAHAGSWEWHIPSGKVIWSPETFALYDIEPTPDGPSYADWEAMIYADDRESTNRMVRNVLEGCEAGFKTEFRVVRRDGTVRWLAGLGNIERAEDGSPLRMSGINIDITERKEVELESARLAAVVTAAPSAVVALDPSSRITAWNPSAERLFGYATDEARGRHISIIVPDERRSEDRVVLERVLGGQFVEIETQRRHKTGHLVDVQIAGSPIRGVNGDVIGQSYLLQDITERKQAEERLRESEERFRQAADGTNALVYSVDLLAGESASAYGVEHIIGEAAPPKGLSSAWWHQRIHPDDMPSHRQNLERCLVEPACMQYKASYRVRHQDGTWRDVEDSARILRGAAGQATRLVGTIFDVSDRKRAGEALYESDERLKLALRASATGVWDWDLTTDRVTWFESILPIFGVEHFDGTREAFARFLHPDDADRVWAAVNAALDTGSLLIEFRIIRGDGEERWVNNHATVFRNGAGKPVRMLGTVRDITERKRQEERIAFLMGEVNHRSKNLLGLVHAIARQTAATRPEDFIERFSQRVQALAANQDLLVKSTWTAVPLDDLVRSQLAHFGNVRETRIALDGPPLQLTASAAQALGMALHELATNAAKYGALSNESGRVSVSWGMKSDAEGGPRFAVSWEESDGPPVAKPSRRGFGSTVIEGMIKMSLGCDAEIEFLPTGLVWRIDCPVEKVIEGRSWRPVSRTNGTVVTAPAPSADRRRVLVVEDEALIAMEIAAALSDAGWEVVGPASTVAQALALVAKTGCDAAVLDTNLGAETAEAVADELLRSGTPFVTVSGYSREQQPPVMRRAPLIAKPLRPGQLVAEISRCFK